MSALLLCPEYHLAMWFVSRHCTESTFDFLHTVFRHYSVFLSPPGKQDIFLLFVPKQYTELSDSCLTPSSKAQSGHSAEQCKFPPDIAHETKGRTDLWQAIIFGELLFPRAGDVEQTSLPASMAEMLFLSDVAVFPLVKRSYIYIWLAEPCSFLPFLTDRPSQRGYLLLSIPPLCLPVTLLRATVFVKELCASFHFQDLLFITQCFTPDGSLLSFWSTPFPVLPEWLSCILAVPVSS